MIHSRPLRLIRPQVQAELPSSRSYCSCLHRVRIHIVLLLRARITCLAFAKITGPVSRRIREETIMLSHPFVLVDLVKLLSASGERSNWSFLVFPGPDPSYICSAPVCCFRIWVPSFWRADRVTLAVRMDWAFSFGRSEGICYHLRSSKTCRSHSKLVIYPHQTSSKLNAMATEILGIPRYNDTGEAIQTPEIPPHWIFERKKRPLHRVDFAWGHSHTSLPASSASEFWPRHLVSYLGGVQSGLLERGLGMHRG